jgi:hypothetical protein
MFFWKWRMLPKQKNQADAIDPRINAAEPHATPELASRNLSRCAIIQHHIIETVVTARDRC